MLKHIVTYLAVLVLLSGFAFADTVTLYPTDDARIQSSNPDENYGDGINLLIGHYIGTFETCIKFDLSPYTGYSLDSATLRLYIYNSIGDFPPSAGTYKSLNSTYWNEETVTWNSRPDYYDNRYGSNPTTYGWWENDATQYVYNVINGHYDNHGMSIGTNSSDERVFMYSKEYSSYHPELVIEFPDAVESATLGGIKAAFR